MERETEGRRARARHRAPCEDHTTDDARALPADDVVFDYSSIGQIDLVGLSLLFTARRMVCASNETVWITGLPEGFWAFLESMGLEEWFEEFPGSRFAEA